MVTLPTPEKSRSRTIDSLRAIAALAVVLGHTVKPTTPVGNLGSIGVYLFFLVSGYCIILSLAKLGEHPVRTFFVRRVFRLYPAYWVAIFLIVVVAPAAFTPKQILMNMTMFQYAFRVVDVNGVFWTLFVEWLFYGLVGMLLVLGLQNRERCYTAGWAGLTVAALIAATSQRYLGLHIPFGHLLFMSLFALGGVMSFRHSRADGVQSLLRPVFFYLVAVLAVSALIFHNGVSNEYTALHYFGNFVIALAVFFCALQYRLFGWKWLAAIGQISYCIYLFHSPIQIILQPIFGIGMSLMLAVTAVTILLSAAVYFLIEKPFIRIGKYLTRPRAIGFSGA